MENFSSVYIFDSNSNSSEVLRSFLEELGIKDIIKVLDYKNTEDFKSISEASIAFVDISQNISDSEKLLDFLKIQNVKVIVTSSDYSTDNIVKALRGGAKDFLPKPIIKNDLKRALNLVSEQKNKDKESSSKIITIYSNKGGIGKTTIATNLAVELAKTTREKVALIDLNLQLGDVSTFLDLNPSFDIAYVIKNLINKKEDILLKAFEKYKNAGLYILSDPTHIEQSESITPQQIETLFQTLRKVFTYIIIDMSSGIDPNTLKILDKSDYILFTSIVNIPAIRNTQRCLNLFKTRRYPNDKVKIILNRYMESDEIKAEDIETTLGEKIYWKIPNNYFSIMEAINKGVPVAEVNSNSNIANSFRDLASKISDDIVKQVVLKHKEENIY